LLFLDADDELLPDSLFNYLRLRRQVPDLRLTIGSFQVMLGDSVEREELVPRRIPNLDRIDGGYLASQFYSDLVTNIASGAICVDKELFNQVGGFDEALWCWEITDLMYRLVLQAGRVGIPVGVQLVVHKNDVNSQFEKTQRDLYYQIHFAHRLLDKMEAVPAAQRDAFLRSVKYALYSTLHGGELSSLRALANRARRYGEDIPEIMKFCRIARLPPFLIRGWLALRKLYRD